MLVEQCEGNLKGSHEDIYATLLTTRLSERVKTKGCLIRLSNVTLVTIKAAVAPLIATEQDLLPLIDLTAVLIACMKSYIWYLNRRTI